MKLVKLQELNVTLKTVNFNNWLTKLDNQKKNQLTYKMKILPILLIDKLWKMKMEDKLKKFKI